MLSDLLSKIVYIHPSLRYITISTVVPISVVSIIQEFSGSEKYSNTNIAKMSSLQLVSAVVVLTILTSSCVKGIIVTLLPTKPQLSISFPFIFEWVGAPIDVQQEIDAPVDEIYYQLFTR